MGSKQKPSRRKETDDRLSNEVEPGSPPPEREQIVGALKLIAQSNDRIVRALKMLAETNQDLILRVTLWSDEQEQNG